MNQHIIEFTDVEKLILNYEVPDEQLEAAAGRPEGRAANMTLSFCSGLDSCPS